MIKRLAGAVLVAGVLSACSSEPPLTPEQQYLKTIHTALDGQLVMYDEKLIDAGRAVCNAIPDPGVTHSRAVAAAAKGIQVNNIPDPFGKADLIVTAAERYLCPTVRYASDAKTVT